MVILNIGDESRIADDLLSGTANVDDLRTWLDDFDDDEPVIVRTDSGFAELGSYESY